MNDTAKMSKQEAIDELRKEAQEIEDSPDALTQYANKLHKIKIRRTLADKLERELKEENSVE